MSMLRASSLMRGSYILSARVVPDWWQVFHREEKHRAASTRIAHLRPSNDYKTADATMSTSSVAPIDLQEANELVDIYTRNHNAVDLTLILQYIRETLQEPLGPFHYQALLRVFNYSRDKDNIEQLLHVMIQHDGLDLGTCARVVDSLHCLSPTNVLPSILHVVALTQKSFGGNMCNAEGCPPLTALLHHVANGAGYTPLEVLLVALWIRALGAQLCDWDYVHIFSALLSQSDKFPQIRSTLSVFNGLPTGAVTPEALFRRLKECGELSPSSGSMNLLVEAMQASLTEAGCSLDSPVQTCLINTRAAGLPAMIECLLGDMATLNDAGMFIGDLLSCYHTLALLYSTLRNDTSAVETIHMVSEEVKRRESAHSSLSDKREYHHYLADVGSLLKRVSTSTVHSVRFGFAKLAQSLCSGLSNNNAVAAESHAMMFVRSNDEAEEALRQVTESVDLTHHRTRFPTKVMFRRFVELCARHPRRNCKMTSTGIEERRKWGRYLDARDTSLALFGSAKQARDSMKHLFYNDNRMPELRNPAMVEQDLNDSIALFKWKHVPSVASLRKRSSVPHVRCPENAVPRHLWDPDVYNPYPHIMLRISPMDDECITDDIFQKLWRILMNPSVVGVDQWYLRDSEMYLLLMRCLIHRLDWEAAAHLTIKTMENLSYTYMMDHELTLMFKEIGDPAGCLAFKVATKLFDGRIIKDGQSKRDKFHQEQFGEV
uniref:Uncharacterized protein n=1 Tax=Trypanosoma vivax (strain Y486) TaxID=1055687 RepID=G0TWQ8_TRYVY|nr:conserved hypothetical protein [Trypanosoma vivax Y486]